MTDTISSKTCSMIGTVDTLHICAVRHLDFACRRLRPGRISAHVVFVCRCVNNLLSSLIRKMQSHTPVVKIKPPELPNMALPRSIKEN